MMTARRNGCSTAALACVAALALPPPFAVRAAAAALTQTSNVQSPQPARSAAASQPAEPDLGWPRTYPVSGGGTATLFQPQIASWENQKHMQAWAAVSYVRPDVTTPAYGTIKIEAQTKVSPEERLVDFSQFRIAEFNFPTLSRDEAQALVAGLQQGVPTSERVLALDRVLAAIDKSKLKPRDTAGIRADPPHIFVSTRPAVLVSVDGAPVWSPIEGVDLSYAVNTNWDLFETSAKVLYLRNNDAWLMARDLKGPWTPAGVLPPGFMKLPAGDNWKEARANIPGRPIAAGAAPRVFVSTTPAELLLLKGAPTYQPVTGTSLLWVSNTESDLFRFGQSGPFYYLVAGRWFSAPSLEGPWTFATPQLPADFMKIPVDHPRSRVLASVPGTDQAAEAVLLAEMPRTGRVNVKEVKAPEVVYEGEPQFQAIRGTTLARAVNTDKDIIKVGDAYFMCFQAVWFVSRSPSGPWEVARSVPQEVYTIPSDSPSYNVTYVTVEADDDPDWVDFAYTAGYTGMMVAWGAAVWGTGWYYPPYVWYGGVRPGYWGYPRTYGINAWYNPWTGNYGRGGAVYGPYGGAGAGAVYNPRTGTYARGAAAYGPYGGRAVAQAWNPRTGTYGATRQGGNIYGNWGSSYVQRGDNWARTGHVTNYATGATTRGIQGSGGGGAATRVGTAGRTSVARGPGGDVYAGHDGNVYRRSGAGSWDQWSGSGWSQAQRSAQASQLNRDSSARAQGAQRTRDFSSFQRSPSMGRAGSFGGGGFRGGGGGFRGGGRR